MCIGIPVKIVESRDFMARCHGRNGEQEVNMMLIGPQEVGTWVLNFLGSAREVLTAEEATQIDNALDALVAVESGDPDVDIDSFFPDLVPANKANPA